MKQRTKEVSVELVAFLAIILLVIFAFTKQYHRAKIKELIREADSIHIKEGDSMPLEIYMYKGKDSVLYILKDTTK